jgi:hypothetical protein
MEVGDIVKLKDVDTGIESAMRFEVLQVFRDGSCEVRRHFGDKKLFGMVEDFEIVHETVVVQEDYDDPYYDDQYEPELYFPHDDTFEW